MRRLLLILIFLIAAGISVVSAANVNPDKAELAALAFFQSGTSTKAGMNSSVRLVWDGSTNVSTKSSGYSQAAPFYVFERDGGGFVIISGESGLKPVLAYSYEGRFVFENLPDNISWWLDGYRTIVRDLRSGAASPDPEAGYAWSAIENRTKAAGQSPVVLLETAKWGQSEPFNQKCPSIEGTKSLTGCVATSCAIMMRYLKYPSAGYGTVPGYISGSTTIPSHSLGSYNWDNMPLTKDGLTDDQKNAIAQLMYDCGTALFSTYGTVETSASTSRIQPAMSDYFKFSKYAELLRREDYKLGQWTDMLKNTLDKDYPVLYQGTEPESEGVHAFLIDGYDNRGYFHFNWGWFGENNGFFSIYDSFFYAGNTAVFNLWKDNNWSSSDVGKLSFDDFGLSASTPYIEEGKNFTVSAKLYNNGTTSYSGNVTAVHVSSNGTIKEELGSASITGLKSGNNQSISISNLKLNKSIAAGDMVRLSYSTSSSPVLIEGNKYSSIPLGYNLKSAISMEYDKFAGKITISGLSGMTYKFNGSNITANTQIVELAKPSSSGTYPLVISNGNETVTINLKF